MVFADLSGGIGQGAVYAGSSIVSASVIAAAVSYNRKRRTISQKLDETATNVNRVLILLGGEEASDLNPHPSPGLVAKVEEYQRANVARKELGDEIMVQFDQHKRIVSDMSAKLDDTSAQVGTLTRQMTKVMADVKSLVADSKPNGGATSRDSLNRIEAELGTGPKEKK